jgi:inosine-uridine nucleoside N-ribohydrolase
MVDTDCGFDDFLAVGALLRSVGKEFFALSTVRGMSPSSSGARKIHSFCLALGGHHVKVLKGAEHRLSPEDSVLCPLRTEWGAKLASDLEKWLDTHQLSQPETAPPLDTDIDIDISSDIFRSNCLTEHLDYPETAASVALGNEARLARGFSADGSAVGPFSQTNPPPGKVWGGYLKGFTGAVWKSADGHSAENQTGASSQTGTREAVMAMLEQCPDGALVLITLGPLTNLAGWLACPRLRGLLKAKLARLWVSGGDVDGAAGGNSGPLHHPGVECNFAMDPAAAAQVFSLARSEPWLARSLRLVTLATMHGRHPRSAEWAAAVAGGHSDIPGSELSGAPDLLASLQASNAQSFLYDPVVIYAALNEENLQFRRLQLCVDAHSGFLSSAGTDPEAPPQKSESESSADSDSAGGVWVAADLDRREEYVEWLLSLTSKGGLSGSTALSLDVQDA